MVGRPRSFDRDAALETALESFWRDGYEETSIAALTDVIGVAPPSLYAAFGSKEQLFDECAARYRERLDTGLAGALAEPTAHAAVRRLLLETAGAHTDPATPPGCLAFAEPSLGEERARVRAAVGERLQRARAEGDLDEDEDPEALAGFVEAVIAGMSTRARDGATREQLSAVAQHAMRAWRS